MTGTLAPFKPTVSINELYFSNNLHTFFFYKTIFESSHNSVKCTEILQTLKPAASDRIILSSMLKMSEKLSNAQIPRKAARPEDCGAFILKSFADELAPVWQPIFQASCRQTHCSSFIESNAHKSH